MQTSFPSIANFVTAAIWAGFAIWLGCQPQALLHAFGIETQTPGMLTEIRAFYGGVEMGIALSMIVLWKLDHLSAALMIGGLPLAGSSIGRMIGLMLDGYSSLHLGFAVLELAGAAFCLAGCYALHRQRAAEVTSKI
ncbi:MAG: DUF4345 family protein [bacterium]|nr:DUF4345 family protein [bacterium]